MESIVIFNYITPGRGNKEIELKHLRDIEIL